MPHLHRPPDSPDAYLVIPETCPPGEGMALQLLVNCIRPRQTQNQACRRADERRGVMAGVGARLYRICGCSGFRVQVLRSAVGSGCR
jgi:hypothetical protein